jgi:hypothetical protein
MLPLDDVRWRELDHRGWTGGSRYPRDTNAPFAPDVLHQLYNNPREHELFDDFSPYLCSEGTTWSAAYAAIPHVVELASRVTAGERASYLIFIGLSFIYSTPDAGESRAIKAYLVDGVEIAKRRAFPLVLETLAVSHDPETLRYLLATVAVLAGFPGIGKAIEDLDLFEQCPHCHTELSWIERPLK